MIQLELIQFKLGPSVAQLSSAIHYQSYFPAAAFNKLIHLIDLLDDVRKIWDKI